MRKIYLLLTAIILLLVAANIYYFLNIYNQQVDFHKNILARQTQICSREIEQYTGNFKNEMEYILVNEEFAKFFADPGEMQSSIRNIEIFFSKYNKLVTGISLYDNNKNVYNIIKEGINNLVTDSYVSRFQRELTERDLIGGNSGEFMFVLPEYYDSSIIANLVVRIDTRKYIESVFDNYHVEYVLWPWLLAKEGNIVFSTYGDDIPAYQNAAILMEKWTDTKEPGGFIHNLHTDDGHVRVISTFYPINILNRDMLVVFSIDTSTFLASIITSLITISSATFIILLLILGIFLYFIKTERGNKDRSMAAEKSIQDIFESLPMGIIIKGFDGKIKLVNTTALKILKIDNKNAVIGKDFSNMFFLFRNYPLKGSKKQRENTNEFIYYDPEDNEIILFKKEIPARFLGEEVYVEAFIDISPVEQARKKEFFFGEAKTEFLKRVSHDIRNPLNGIMNIADSLEPEIKSIPSGPEKTDLIRRCCEDILFVVNDIMDFSSFEAANILVEEVPFSLHEEIELAVGPMRNKARENNIEITTVIPDNVTGKLIGDPFHLRQVLTNLISNSLKHTREGEIRIVATTKKPVAGNIRLGFTIEDTGLGISPGLLAKLNKSGYDQEEVPGGSFGLKKTRQLINLMKGDMHIESPVRQNPQTGGPGTRIKFHLQVYSNEVSGKNLNFNNIKKYSDIRTLVLAEPGETKPEIRNLLAKMGIPCEITKFNNSTIGFIRSRMADPALNYSIIIIIDSQKSNGFAIARKLHESKLNENFLIIIISSANKPGNFIKSRRLGVDHYLIEPNKSSEIFDIIKSNFPDVEIPASKKSHFKRTRPGLKILVAEDNRVNQIVAQSLFKSIGYDIDLASNGKEALAKVRDKDYDIIFMDIRMPEKNGLDSTCEIRQLGFTMPIVAMTANAGETDKTEAMEAGMTDFIAKPVRIDILKNIIVKRFSK